MAPEAGFISPAMASASSICPLPDTPATTKISPSRTEKETSFTTSYRSSFRTVRCSTRRTSLPNLGSGLSTVKLTSRPTIRLAMVRVSVSATFKMSISFPRQRIAQRSAIFLISSSLCVIRMMVLPSSRRLRMISSRNSISWGVSTAVGSSKMRISASR